MSSSRTVVLDVVGLSSSLISAENTPNILRFADAHGGVTPFSPTFPAVTCSAQSTFLTGESPASHGIVGNGWYNRELCEVQFWKQPDQLVKGSKIWHKLREMRPDATTAKVFWWYNMYSEVEYSLTPRPMYPADGRKVFDIYTHPANIRFDIQRDDELGPFPFFNFWGPKAGIGSSRWIADSAMWVEEKHSPTLSLVYLPHLDYPLQKVGPDHESIPAELQAIDSIVGELIDFYQSRGVTVQILSEYGIEPVDQPIHINRILRDEGWITVKDELGLELLDAGASRAFAVADHQFAHVYLNDHSLTDAVRTLLERTPGIASVVTPEELGWPADSTAADRAGDLIAIAEAGSWFTYYYWVDDALAPDFARTIDIHRKPGYDPAELFIDPELKFPALKIAKFLAKKKLGLRGLLDVIPLDASLVKGSHGRIDVPEHHRPVFIGLNSKKITADTDVQAAILETLG
ncbi:nucleotide pyrophosphatase/phosphodiesterase family protein [Sulfuriroseicoccus oceanibius]|uniref:Alkaline phosphatase family protein n=1 Tax=Sulfuriroseicoccus oceanibius TaxID=2707525 RepID=A0A6B3LDB7_9BACT|nr:nucleotide pyrophosphatase/phosphodiesterase family protein [Sulfuriroseicoccus oceanibius]QQL44800.1 alkaline phosphatase family protein [Sulfuriroseicoccus oceanibius]